MNFCWIWPATRNGTKSRSISSSKFCLIYYPMNGNVAVWKRCDKIALFIFTSDPLVLFVPEINKISITFSNWIFDNVAKLPSIANYNIKLIWMKYLVLELWATFNHISIEVVRSNRRVLVYLRIVVSDSVTSRTLMWLKAAQEPRQFDRGYHMLAGPNTKNEGLTARQQRKVTLCQLQDGGTKTQSHL